MSSCSAKELISFIIQNRQLISISFFHNKQNFSKIRYGLATGTSKFLFWPKFSSQIFFSNWIFNFNNDQVAESFNTIDHSFPPPSPSTIPIYRLSLSVPIPPPTSGEPELPSWLAKRVTPQFSHPGSQYYDSTHHLKTVTFTHYTLYDTCVGTAIPTPFSLLPLILYSPKNCGYFSYIYNNSC